ncbi:ABC transporter substrate-binding protein, partial [Rhodococcus erythropolis]|nr:ABC transporter substrate-binding protein [Rhodococcus erythropolis]
MKLHKPGVLTLTATAAIGALLITSCSSPTGTGSSGNNDGLVLADGYELGGYNPVAGFGAAGEAKMYDGLVRLTGGTGMPGFEPSLAAEMPT